MDKISIMLVCLIVLFEDNKEAKNKYLRMLHSYCSSTKRALNGDEFVKDVALMSGTLRELTQMRVHRSITR